jgi:hypothetical protein
MSPSAATPSVGWLAGLVTGTDEADCAVCGMTAPVETPECNDGHGSDCPERLCSACGAAVLIHTTTLSMIDSARRGSSRRAA